MTMFMNLDQLDGELFTIYVTNDEPGTPREDVCADEVDVVFNARHFSDAGVHGPANYGKVHPSGEHVPSYLMEVYGDDVAIIGIVNQSAGYVTYDAFESGDWFSDLEQ